MLKYVAGPQSFAYMPPLLGGTSIIVGMMLWLLGMMAGFSVIIGIVIGLIGCATSAYVGFKEPHISNMLLARQKFMKKTPGLVPYKGKHYVG
jgi:hypothetical protein